MDSPSGAEPPLTPKRGSRAIRYFGQLLLLQPSCGYPVPLTEWPSPPSSFERLLGEKTSSLRVSIARAAISRNEDSSTDFFFSAQDPTILFFMKLSFFSYDISKDLKTNLRPSLRAGFHPGLNGFPSFLRE
ncbi:hypothetical protein LINPERPRIM_LOCUS28483 [Linum perenne]